MNRGVLMLLSGSLCAQTLFQIHGYIQGRFTNQEGAPDQLEIRRARLIVSGDPVSNLSYTFRAYIAKRPYVMDAAITWKFARALRLTAAQFKPNLSDTLLEKLVRRVVLINKDGHARACGGVRLFSPIW